MKRSVILLLAGTAITAAASDFQLAQTYAPTIYQGIGSDPAADEFTYVDFDGDWNPDNNWENMTKFSRRPAVYWDVMESENHYYITYAFFYPRDYSRLCFFMHCHENDFEGMRVTVRKPSKVVRLEGLAHNFRSEVLNPDRVEVSIEAEGHGVHPLERERAPVTKVYAPSAYTLVPLAELWSKKESGLFSDTFEYQGKTYPSRFGGDNWIVFGLGAAKPPWAWEIWKSDFSKGEWFFHPHKLTGDKVLRHQMREESETAISIRKR